MTYSVPLQDIEMLARTGRLSVSTKPELRVIYLGLDQARPELLDSSIKGKNPFKDVRVRRAIWKAIDSDAISSRLMRNLSRPTALMIAPEVNGYHGDLDHRPGYDPSTAKALLADAGYPDGFEVGMDCPNDRYVRDEAICQAIATMLARVGIVVKLSAQPRAKYFQKINSPEFRTSFFMLGWTPVTVDAHNAFQNLIVTRDATRARGHFNNGGYSNASVDALTDLIQTETDPAKRQKLISEALRIHRDDVGHIPLHQQVLVWAARAGIKFSQLPTAEFPIRYMTMP